MTHLDSGTTMRGCGRPGCTRAFDIAALFDGTSDAGPWHRNRLVRYLCPDHNHGQHVPDWTSIAGRAVPQCSCGWVGAPAVNIRGARDQWCAHVHPTHPMSVEANQ